MEGTSLPSLSKQHTNHEKKRKNSDPNFTQNSRCYFCEFCDNTSIHGFKFIGERRRYVIEKIWWLLVVSGAIFGSGFLISKAYQKWDSSPVVVNFSTKETSIWQIPFPAVTICPETKMKKKVFDYTKVYHKLLAKLEVPKEERDYFNLFQMICDDLPEDVQDNKTDTLEEYLEKFKNASFEMAETNCKWLGVPHDCEKLLNSMLTSDGYCRTFNMLSAEEIYVDGTATHGLKNAKSQQWSLQEGYPPSAGVDAYPRRTMLAGLKGGFQIDLSVNEKDLDYLCGELQGYKVTLHHPGEEPDMDKSFLVPLNQVVVVAIKPQMIKTSDEIRAYRPEKRQCYLPDEKELEMYKIYSQQNCMFECLLNYTLAVCDCYPFYVVSEEKSCGPGSKECVNDAKVKFLEQDVDSDVHKLEHVITEVCGCLPACTSLEFYAETSQTDWDWRKGLRILDLEKFTNSNVYDYHQSRLVVYYKDMQFMTSARHELYGIVDFLANCGGLLGLFCGFSFISAMEIFYYLTLRVICNVRKFGRKLWSGAPELLEKM